VPNHITNTMKLFRLFPVVLLMLGILGPSNIHAQSATILAVMDSTSLEDQLDFVRQKTRVYDNFRAIREDIFLKMKKNSIDSLNAEKLEVARLQSELTESNFQIVNLNADPSRTKEERDQAIRTKDSFSFLGMQVQKGVYNTVMWIIVLALVSTGIILFLLFKRSYVVTTSTRKELDNLQEEYETYRKDSREKYEKLVVSHHNEIMKLKRS